MCCAESDEAGRGFSLAHLTIAETDPLTCLQIAAEAGYGAASLRLTGFAPDPQADAALPQTVRRLRQEMAASGLRLSSACTYRLQDERRPQDYLRLFDACAELDVPFILLTHFVTDPGAAQDLLAGMAEAAAARRLRLGLELIPVSCLPDLEAALALCRAVGAANLGHVIDALHFCRAGHGPADLARIEPARIYALQLCDGPAGRPPLERLRSEVRDRLLPGTGALPLHDLRAAIPGGTPLEIEAPVAATAHLPPLERAKAALAAALPFSRAAQQV